MEIKIYKKNKINNFLNMHSLKSHKLKRQRKLLKEKVLLKREIQNQISDSYYLKYFIINKCNSKYSKSY